ncbi:MAG TPA: energy transducer TonB [Pyrinomonadaceae bacterium]|nr:energy transducer TonB [Pyrinomonadaceae bacterium]
MSRTVFCLIVCALFLAAGAPAAGQEAGGAAKEAQGERAAGGEESSEADDTVYSPDDVDERVKIVSQPSPDFPAGLGAAAGKCTPTGVVRLRVVLLASGEVGDVEVVASPADELAERSVRAARRIVFVPARKGGRPVSVRTYAEYRFDLLSGTVYADRFLKVYYPAGCSSYSAISKDMRVCFDSEKEAGEAGYKKSKSKCP